MPSQSLMSKGSIYLEEVGGTTGALPVGNAKDLSLAFNEDKKEQKDYEDAGGAVVNTVSTISSVTGSVTLLDFKSDNLAKALRALVTVVAAGTVVAEAHIAYDDAFIALDKLATKGTIVVKNIGGATTYVEDTDYTVKKNGIVIIASGSIANGVGVEIDYTNVASRKVQGLADSSKEYRLYFDGINEADSGNPVQVTMHRVKLNPTQALALISDDFAELPMTFDLLKDTTIIGAGLSQFISIELTA